MARYLGESTLDPEDRTQRALNPTDPLMHLPAGTTLGLYRIERLLSAGGMGILYAASHAQLGKRVALKVLNPRFNQQPEFIERFFGEARAVNRIKNEHIVEIYDCVRQPNGLNYLVMELLEGADLWTTREKEGPLALARVVRIARETAKALRAAHARKIIHRDLKPENIFLVRFAGRPEFVKLLDFGIAKLAESGRLPTQTGLVMGTPGFMAPEQALGRHVDARADVYAFGVLLCWMLWGQVPFEQEQTSAIDARGEALTPWGPASEGGEPIPSTLRALVQQCLVFKREQRLGSMAAVLEALDGTTGTVAKRSSSAPREPQPTLRTEPVSDPQKQAPSKRYSLQRIAKLVVTTVVGSLLALGTLAWWALPAPPSKHPVPVALPSKPVPLPPAPAPFATAPKPTSLVRPSSVRPMRHPVRMLVPSPVPMRRASDRQGWHQGNAQKPEPKDPLDRHDGTEEWQ